MNLGNGNITINGDISANGTFTLQAQDANVNGQLSAANFANYVNGNLNMNKIPNDITITEDYVETVFSDEYMQNIYFADSSVVEGNYEISNPNINISETTIVDGAISLNGNVNVNSNLKANGDISITGNVENTVNSVIYSQDGNITLNSDNVNFDGFIYAPNGKVTIEGSNVTINGIIIAESLEIKGNNVVFNVSDVLGANNDDFNVTLNAFQFMLADVNFDNVVEFLDAIRLNQKIASLSA